MFKLIAEKRNIFGKKLKKERENGKIPAVLYGKNQAVISIFAQFKEFQKLYKKAGETNIIEVDFGNEKINTIIHDVQFDPLSDFPIHADFLIVKMDEPIEVTVPLVFSGDSEAVKSGGILVKVIHEITVKALPQNLPHEIEIDISKLKTVNDKIIISDIAVLKTVSILDKDPEDVVALIETPREEEKEIVSEIDFTKIEATKEKKANEEKAEK